MNYLKSKERKQIVNTIEKQWGSCPEEIKEKVLVKTGRDRIYLANRDLEKVDMTGIRINNVGLYIAEEKNELRLSIEGAQLIGPQATKNVMDVNDEQQKQWFMGEDIAADTEFEGFVILKHKNDFIGSGKYKEGRISDRLYAILTKRLS